MRRFLILVLALLASTALSASLAACAIPEGGSPSLRVTSSFSPTPTPTNTPKPSKTPTPTATATPTEVPMPSGLENLPPGITAVHNEDDSWGIGIGTGNEITPVPNTVFDSIGLHMTLDSGRTVDISVSELQKRIAYNQEFDLLKIYDDQGIISAEYDPGVGQPDSPDYIPGQGWVDIQKLAQDLVCKEGPTCFTDARGTPIPGGIFVELSSTGIFRYVDALDQGTGEVIGNFLLVQVVTREKETVPATVWVLVQAESSSEPGVNAFFVGVRTIRYRLEGELTDQSEYLMLYPVQKWREWMPKGSTWSLEFSKSGYLYPFLTFIGRSQIMADKNKTQAIGFLTGSGISSGGDFILVLIASAPRW